MSLLTKSQIVPLIKENLKIFNIFDFCPNGGWPDFEKLEVSVNSIQPQGSEVMVSITLYYHCNMPASCFKGDSQEVCILEKNVLIHQDKTISIISPD